MPGEERTARGALEHIPVRKILKMEAKRMKRIAIMAVILVLMAGLTLSTGINAATTFKIGGLAALQLSYGKSMMSGAKLAIDEINAAGGVNGIKFEIDWQDSEGTASTGRTAPRSTWTPQEKVLDRARAEPYSSSRTDSSLRNNESRSASVAQNCRRQNASRSVCVPSSSRQRGAAQRTPSSARSLQPSPRSAAILSAICSMTASLIAILIVDLLAPALSYTGGGQRASDGPLDTSGPVRYSFLN